GAVVRYASFGDVTFEDDNPPNFRNSAWWTAIGWDKNQRKILTAKFRDEDPKETESFKRELKFADENLDQASDSVSRGKGLKQKDWMRAMYGVELNSAESAVRQALTIYNTDGNPKASPRDVGNAQDTLGYILIQKRRFSEAQKLLSDAMRNRDDA